MCNDLFSEFFFILFKKYRIKLHIDLCPISRRLIKHVVFEARFPSSNFSKKKDLCELRVICNLIKKNWRIAIRIERTLYT